MKKALFMLVAGSLISSIGTIFGYLYIWNHAQEANSFESALVVFGFATFITLASWGCGIVTIVSSLLFLRTPDVGVRRSSVETGVV